MKRSFLLFLAVILCTGAMAQSERFITAMKSNIAAIDTSFKNPQSLLSLANNFERIAQAEKSQWLPYYYAALCQIYYTYMEPDKSKVDAIADKATELINKADSLAQNNSEISCVKSMIASSHLMVDPMNRYMQYGPESSKHTENAIKQDTTNPRPYLLRGQALRYTPEPFGGGCKTAIPELEKAIEKFNAFKPASDISPNWGKARVEALLEECKK